MMGGAPPLYLLNKVHEKQRRPAITEQRVEAKGSHHQCSVRIVTGRAVAWNALGPEDSLCIPQPEDRTRSFRLPYHTEELWSGKVYPLL